MLTSHDGSNVNSINQAHAVENPRLK